MKKSILLLLLLITCQCLPAQRQIIDSRSGIPIVFDDDGDVFPRSWIESPTDGKFEPLDTAEIRRSKEVIIRSLAKYPVTVLKENLRKIYVFRNLEFFNQVFGGTNSTDVVYVTNNGISNGYTDDYIERVFHAEFSSVLLRKYKANFDESKWKACNGRDIVYGTSGVDALRTGKTGQDFDEKLNESGILNEYALSDMENDFNAFAQNMFLPKPGFWDLCDQYPPIRKKVRLFIAFYSLLDPAFTEEYFRRF